MSGLAVIVLIFVVLAAGLGAVAYFTYQRKLRRAKAIERGLKMVPILIHLPPPSADTQGGNRDMREVMREKTAQAEVLYNLIAGTATEGFASTFYGQRHMALELIAIDGVVHFYAAVPVVLVSVATKAIQTAYPGARMEEVEDYNIFNQEGRLAATLGGEMVLRQESAYPIATYAKLERDPMEALLTTISALGKKDGVAIQMMLRPANRNWVNRSKKVAEGMRKGRHQTLGFSAMDLAKAAVMSPTARRDEERARLGGSPDVSNLQLSEVESIEEKTKHPGFEVLVRVIVSTESVARSQQLLRDIATAFALFESPGLNGFKFLPALDVQGLVTAFIFRFFPPELRSNVLNSVELATLFHLPDSQFTPTRSIEREQSKQVDGPIQLPTSGLLFGHNDFRGVKKEIRLSPEDRRRHTYILGQTGTGKSTMLENLAVQDMLAGNGFAFIDPHGDSAEKLLALVPKERAEDVIYFNPADTEYPLGLNLFEFTDPSQKDFLVQETINMLYKLYDPGHTGIIGPRYEHWYRNAALTLMADPGGATFIEIPKVFTDTEYLKTKFKHLRDPTVIDFWTKEMGQTSDYHKSEMLGWFVSKFGAFQNNEMMRNIIGQTKSAFNIRDVMDKKKILIVNLSKGRIGELNSQLLGMVFVIKFQAAAMSRADVPEDQRADFCLYVDEFQNFSTDSFASILSEARKYRLNLVVANQFIGQLSDEIRDAVFGNIGSIVAHRMGPDDAEFMVKQFAPVFDASDLVNIPNYNAAMRLMIGGLPSQPFTLKDSAPIGQPNLELGLAIKQLSAAKFGNSKSTVEADIIDRFNAKPASSAPPAPVDVVAAPAPIAAPTAVAAPVPVTPVAVAPAPVAVAPAPVPVPVAVAAVPVAVAEAPIAAPVSSSVTAVAPPPVPVVAAAPVAQVYAPVVAVAAPDAAVTPVAAPVVSMPTPPLVAVATPSLQTVAAPPLVNTAGQVLSPVSPIIPEENDEGGFSDMNAPLGAPAVPPPMPEPGGMATTPPPIGAPPVDLSGAVTAPIAPPVDAIQPATASYAPVPDLAVAPPPIGAPPVDLSSMAAGPALPVQLVAPAAPVQPEARPEPVMAMTPRPASQDSSGTLSLVDITGGRPPAPRPVSPAMVQVMAPQQPTYAPQAPAQQMQQAPLGSGQALPTDPYANIDILADLTPPGMANLSAVPLTGPAATPLLPGSPMPNDPYGGIDVLGAVPAPPVAAAPVPVAQAPAPEPPPALQPAPAPDPTPSPVYAPAPAPAPVYAPTPMSAPVPAPASLPPTPAPYAAPAYAPPPLPAPAPAPVYAPPPLPAPAPAPVYAPAPIPTAAPVPQLPPAPVYAPRASPAPAVAPVYAAPAPLPEPEPRLPAAEQAQVSASAPVLSDEPLIHFVDPAAQEVLNRPDVPDAVSPQNDADLLFSGLPEGVQITKPAPAEPQSPAPVAQVPVAPVQVAAPAPVPAPIAAPSTVATAPEPAPIPAHEPLPIAPAPAPTAIAAPISALSTPLTNMAKTPPPIGSAPIDIGEVAVPAAPVVVAEPPKPKPREKEPVPQLNASLAAALSESPEVPLPKAAAVHPAESLEAVAQMPGVTGTDSATTKSVEAAAAPTAESTPAPPEAKPTKPPTPTHATPAAQIEKAEHEIDDMLSVSLIHTDTSASHHRLPEPVETTRSESNIDMEMNPVRTVSPAPAQPAAPGTHAADHHGLKVIQPLERIVPAKEAFAKEIAELARAEQTPTAAAAPAVKAQAAPVTAAPVATAPTSPAASAAPAPVASPAVKQPGSPVAIVKHEGQMLEAPPEPVAIEGVVPESDDGIPQAESLAADDVAKARAERQADVAMQQAAPIPDAPVKTDAQPAAHPQPPTGKPPKQKPAKPPKHEKVVEHVESEAEAEHNRPTEAEKEQGAMTGKLILPTGEKPKPAPVQPKVEKPKKLAPGEVFVDEHGNVVIGE